MIEPQTIGTARVLMSQGFGMKQVADILQIIPSGSLDHALWHYIDVPTAELLKPKSERRKRYSPDF